MFLTDTEEELLPKLAILNMSDDDEDGGEDLEGDDLDDDDDADEDGDEDDLGDGLDEKEEGGSGGGSEDEIY